MHKYLLIIGMFLLVIALPAQRVLSLEEAKSIALEQNYGYRAGEAALSAAEWQKTSAFSAFLPNLSLSATLLYMDPARRVQNTTLNKDQRSISLNLSQPLFLGGKLYQSYKMASASAEMAELNLQAKRLELLSEVESKYYALLQLKEVLDIAMAEHSQAQTNLELAEIKLQNGLIARADLLRFQANLANKDIAVLQSQTAYDLAQRDFANYLGSSELLSPMPLALSDAEILPLAQLDSEGLQRIGNALTKLGKNNNLQLKLIDSGVEISERAYKMSKGSFLPSLNLIGSRSYDENGIDRYEFEASNQIMLNLSIPLLPQVGNYAASRKAYFEAQKASMEAKQASDGILLGIDAAVIRMVSSARQVRTAKLSLDITQDMYAQLSERFRLNMISTLELMDAELMLSASRMAYANAYYEFFKARLALLSLVGTDDYSILNAILAE